MKVRGAPLRAWMKGTDLFYRLTEDPRPRDDANLSAFVEPVQGTKGPKAEIYLRFRGIYAKDDYLEPPFRTMLQVYDRKGEHRSSGHPIELVHVDRPIGYRPDPTGDATSDAPGPFDFEPVTTNDALEEQRDAYLTAVPNANEDQLESGLYTLDEMARVLSGKDLATQARAVLALSFFDQGVILSGGVGPDTKKVLSRVSGISPDLIRNLASVGESQIRREGLYDPSAADARRVVRDMKGASLAAAELLALQRGTEAAGHYMEALEQAAQGVDTRKATKAELANVARLLQLDRPDRFRSWSAVPKSDLKDLIEDQLDTLVNPILPSRPRLGKGKAHATHERLPEPLTAAERLDLFVSLRRHLTEMQDEELREWAARWKTQEQRDLYQLLEERDAESEEVFDEESREIYQRTRRERGKMKASGEQLAIFNPVPPQAVAMTARGALERRRNASGTRPGGTSIGIARARDLANRRNVSEETLRRMVSFFSRHDGRQERDARRDSNSPAAIAWDLWGGDAGRDWARDSLDRIDSD